MREDIKQLIKKYNAVTLLKKRTIRLAEATL